MDSMAPWAADEKFLKKIRRVVKRRRSRGSNRSNTKSRCEALERLLRRSRDNEAYENTVNTALMEFTEEGLHEEAQVLLNFDANPDHREGWGHEAPTLLHVAVKRGDVKMVKILMENGASASETAEDETPLVMACMSDDKDCVRTMLEIGADTNTLNWSEGKTPLMLLVEEGKSLDVLELLLENGANPNLVSYHRWSLEAVLYYLIRNSLKDNVEELPRECEYAVKAVRLLLRYTFRPRCCGEEHTESLLKLSLENFTRMFPLAVLLLEREEPFEPEHLCWSRFGILREALHSSVQSRSEAEARPLLNKANALLDRAILKPPLLRFTLRPGPGAHENHQGTEWVVDTVLASLQSLCQAVIRSSVLPCPLKPKIQALPLPDQIKDLLMPLNQDE